MSRTSSGFESFQMPSYAESSSVLSNRVQDMMPRNFSTPSKELPSSLNFNAEIYGDGWKNSLPSASSEQIKSSLDRASGIVFSSAADNAKDKVEPDFYLGEDGKLRANPNKTAANQDGSINIELQTKNKNESDSIKYADQMQKAAVKDLINYFRQSNPNGRVPQHWLDMLSKEPARNLKDQG